jgi:hypothetical protein
MHTHIAISSVLCFSANLSINLSIKEWRHSGEMCMTVLQQFYIIQLLPNAKCNSKATCALHVGLKVLAYLTST